jgi:AI-2E family transporter
MEDARIRGAPATKPLREESPDSPGLVPGPAQVSPPSGPDLATLVMIVFGVVIIAALYLAREVLIPITLAILLSFVLGPVVGLLRRIHVPRFAAVLLAVVLALTIFAGLGSIIGVQIASLAPDIPAYASTIGRKIDAVQSLAVGQLSRVVAGLRDRSAAALLVWLQRRLLRRDHPKRAASPFRSRCINQIRDLWKSHSGCSPRC